MSKLMMFSFLWLYFSVAIVFAQNFPIHAVAGKCYAKCFVPYQFETVREQVLIKEASSRFEFVPAQYESQEEKVIVKAAYQVLEVSPPTFTTQMEPILIKEANTHLEYVPPVYETRTEQIMVKPAYMTWVRPRYHNNIPGCYYNEVNFRKYCHRLCYVKVAAKYKTITHQILRAPASVREKEIPAQYDTITKAIVQIPARIEQQQVPAEYRTITKQVLVQPAMVKEVAIPAEYQVVETKRSLAMGGGFTDWVEVLCDSK